MIAEIWSDSTDVRKVKSMKRNVLRYALFLFAMCTISVVSACGKNPEPIAKERYFQVEDVFTITLDETKYTVVTGYSVGGTIYVDDTLFLESDGERIETKVVSFETLQDEHPTSAKENEVMAVWIDQYLSEIITEDSVIFDIV